MADVDFGTDVSTFPTLDPTFTLISGNRAVAEALMRRLMTDYGSLPYDLDYGFNLTDYINDDVTPRELARMRARIEAECLKDERVLSVDVTTTFDYATGTLDVTLAVTTAAGPFTLVLAANDVTVGLLNFSA